MLQLTTTRKNVIQPRLEIGRPDDKYEKEADAVADRVMRMPSSESLQMKSARQGPAIQMKCAICQEEEKLQMKAEAESGNFLQMKSGESEKMAPAPEGLSSQLIRSKGSGRPLPERIKGEMGAKIGSDFSGVKVHTDNRAVQMSREIGARAFTYGSDIYFNQGEYSPQSSQGKHLLAHELTHVVQQEDSRTLIQKEPASAITVAGVIGWCLSGAAVSVLIDQVIQGGGWVMDRITFGRWNIKQNWCKTIFSALFGCVFGMVGGAAARMVFAEIASFSIAQLSRWVHQKLVGAGLSFLAGKWGVMIAKTGCENSNAPAEVDAP